MLSFLWMICVLFAEMFKAKINTNTFRFETFTFYMLYPS